MICSWLCSLQLNVQLIWWWIIKYTTHNEISTTNKNETKDNHNTTKWHHQRPHVQLQWWTSLPFNWYWYFQSTRLMFRLFLIFFLCLFAVSGYIRVLMAWHLNILNGEEKREKAKKKENRDIERRQTFYMIDRHMLKIYCLFAFFRPSFLLCDETELQRWHKYQLNKLCHSKSSSPSSSPPPHILRASSPPPPPSSPPPLLPCSPAPLLPSSSPPSQKDKWKKKIERSEWVGTWCLMSFPCQRCHHHHRTCVRCIQRRESQTTNIIRWRYGMKKKRREKEKEKEQKGKKKKKSVVENTPHPLVHCWLLTIVQWWRASRMRAGPQSWIIHLQTKILNTEGEMQRKERQRR